jgi:hypothetical protein
MNTKHAQFQLRMSLWRIFVENKSLGLGPTIGGRRRLHGMGQNVKNN